MSEKLQKEIVKILTLREPLFIPIRKRNFMSTFRVVWTMALVDITNVAQETFSHCLGLSSVTLCLHGTPMKMVDYGLLPGSDQIKILLGGERIKFFAKPCNRHLTIIEMFKATYYQIDFKNRDSFISFSIFLSLNCPST